MKVQIAVTPLGEGKRVFHVTVYQPGPAHGRMFMVAAQSLARALYTAWLEVYGEAVPLDLAHCDGYLIGEVTECTT